MEILKALLIGELLYILVLQFTHLNLCNLPYAMCRFIDPQPSYSAYREASFGHAILDIKNRTHAHFTWHRNHDSEPVAADSLWMFNRYWYPQEENN